MGNASDVTTGGKTATQFLTCCLRDGLRKEAQGALPGMSWAGLGCGALSPSLMRCNSLRSARVCSCAMVWRGSRGHGGAQRQARWCGAGREFTRVSVLCNECSNSKNSGWSELKTIGWTVSGNYNKAASCTHLLPYERKMCENSFS